MIMISALSGLSKTDLMLLQEYLCLRETGLDQDTAYSFMDGRHESAQKALVRLQKEYDRQEQAQKSEQRPPRIQGKPATRQYSSAKEYLKSIGHLKPDEIRVSDMTPPPDDVGDIQMSECEGGSPLDE
jgi:hypothetical protein